MRVDITTNFMDYLAQLNHLLPCFKKCVREVITVFAALLSFNFVVCVFV